MKIAFIKRNFSIHGGAERYLQTLLNSLNKENFEIHIFANKWHNQEKLFFHHVPIIPFSSFLKAYSFNRNLNVDLKDFDCVISFERTKKQHIYRAGEGCHIRWLELRSLLESPLKKTSFKLNPLHIYYLKLEKEIFEDTPLILANSEMIKNEIINYYGIDSTKIVVIYNGVDTERFSPSRRQESHRQKYGLPLDRKIIIFVGSGFKRKGLMSLLKAMKILKKEPYFLVVVGKGDKEKYLKECYNLGISDKVLFLGVTSEIENFYAMADLFVLPTIYDPFSNSTLEAMASGLPVITTVNNGVAELIEEGKEGFCIQNPFDYEELADKISKATKNAEKMGEYARKKAEQFSIERATKEFIRCIEKFL